ncbi:hypothetical protein [Streptomyces sp. NPDC004528]|uniref:hypothetical protein n=1 Tax=Streptomyces sp. NPDC004528 TaxID=3154550 RepID=UPI0033B372BB
MLINEGEDMEITISGGRVRPVRAAEFPVTPQAIEARRIASLLPPACLRVGAKVVHNVDSGYTGIRFEGPVGPIVLEVPIEGQWYRIVQEFIEPNKSGKTEVELRRFPRIYKPEGVAQTAADFLMSRGFLK